VCVLLEVCAEFLTESKVLQAEIIGRS